MWDQSGKRPGELGGFHLLIKNATFRGEKDMKTIKGKTERKILRPLYWSELWCSRKDWMSESVAKVGKVRNECGWIDMSPLSGGGFSV